MKLYKKLGSEKKNEDFIGKKRSEIVRFKLCNGHKGLRESRHVSVAEM